MEVQHPDSWYHPKSHRTEVGNYRLSGSKLRSTSDRKTGLRWSIQYRRKSNGWCPSVGLAGPPGTSTWKLWCRAEGHRGIQGTSVSRCKWHTHPFQVLLPFHLANKTLRTSQSWSKWSKYWEKCRCYPSRRVTSSNRLFQDLRRSWLISWWGR